MNNPLSRLLNAEQAVAKALEDAKPKRADARYLELRQLPAVANYHAAKELRVSSKIAVTTNHETIAVVCSKTGITIEMILPKIPGQVLEYLNPLSIYANVKGIISQGTDYLSKLDAQILAGVWLTAYRHYNLVAENPSTKDSAVALNAMLRTAGKTILVDSLDLMLHITSSNAHKLPKFSLDYNAHKEFTSVGPALQEHNRAIRNIIYPSAESFYSKSSEAKELAQIEAEKYKDNTSYVLKTPKASRMSSDEKAYEEQFILNRREAKQILSRLTESREIPSTYIAKLKPVFVGKNLVAMASITRNAVVAKLSSFNSADAKRLAEIVKEGHNPYDVFADIDDAFVTNEANLAPTTVAKPAKKLSLAEILDAKRKGISLNSVEPSEPVAPVVQLTYTAEDELRHMEIEQALDEGAIVSPEDAKWNNAYLRAKEAQDAYDVEYINDEDAEERNDGTDF